MWKVMKYAKPTQQNETKESKILKTFINYLCNYTKYNDSCYILRNEKICVHFDCLTNENFSKVHGKSN